MPQVTIIGDEVRTVEGTVTDGSILIAPDRLPDGLGWELKPEGLCRAGTCVPVPDGASLFVGGQLDLATVAAALGRPAVIDADAAIAAVALDGESRRQALDGLRAPPWTLDDLDGVAHELAEWHGRKKLLVAFATW
jgi:hypothetical protein